MRRYRFGMIAAPLAAAYVAVIVAAGLFALVTGDNTLLRWIVADGWTEIIPFVWWVELLVVAGGILQGWAYWQILRGRPAGEPHRGGTAVRLLRVALYLSVACDMIFRLPLPIPYRWWLGLLGELVNVAVVCLFFVVLAGVLPLPLRIVGLVAGLGAAVLGVMTTVVVGLAQDSLLNVVLPLPTHLVNLTWLVLVLVGQARDPRWSRATVGTGVAAAALSFLSPEGSFGFVSQGDADPIVVLMMLTQVLGVLWSVWEARSAHELANPPGPPSPRAAPTRAAPQPWPLVALAVVPPLIPAAVNLAQGMPVWIGPRGAVTGFFRDFAGPPASQMWVAVDLLVGVGAPAVLIVIVAVRRTRRLVRGAVWALTLAAAAGVVTAATTDTGQDWGHFPYLDEQRLRYYPEGLFVPDQNHGLQFGISPLWYSLALAVSALVLFVLYTRPHVIRPRHHVLVGAAGALTALCFLPAADHAHGPVTTPDDCTPRHRDPEADRERSDGARSFICDVRTSKVLEAADTMPDLALLEYGRRLCDIYTRNDPRELARVRSVHGLDVRGLSGTLAGICPAADAAVKARQAAQDREFEAWEAEEQRKCDATPRHRPRIRPVKAIRLKEPQWVDAGLEMYEDAATNARDDVYPQDGLVLGGPGHLILNLHADHRVCVTVETYARRPPVEVKGWDQVVEVGYHSPTGRMVFNDGLSGTALPDLSLHGRKGHYRIRVHYAWFPWKGERYGTQRLLIMAYPGPGDKFVTYRDRLRR